MEEPATMKGIERYLALLYVESFVYKMIKHTVKKEKDYVQIQNAVFSNNNISLKVKGILALMLSLPDSRDFRIEGIASKCKESKHSISTAVNELQEAGYISRRKVRGSDGRIQKMKYEVFEVPGETDVYNEEPSEDEPYAEKYTKQRHILRRRK